MAVKNDYVDTNLAVATDKKTNGLSLASAEVHAFEVTFEVAAADDDGSIYRICKGIDPNLIPLSLRIACDALTGSTGWDVGFYDGLAEGGAVIIDNILGSGIDLSAGYSRILAKDALVSVDLADCGKRIFELCGHTLSTRHVSYDLALTADTVGSGAGTITVFGFFVHGS